MPLQKKKIGCYKVSRTFKSYVDFDADDDGHDADKTTSSNGSRLDIDSDNKENFASGSNLTVDLPNGRSKVENLFFEPKLLPGEVVVKCTNSVMKFDNMSDNRTGISGSLCCTNFKLSFITLEDYPSNLRLRNLLLQENDICLMNIDSIYQVINGRKKKLASSVNISGDLKVVEIHCKDLRIYTFSFKFCSQCDSKDLLNAALHHSSPGQVQLLFAFDYVGFQAVKSIHPSSWTFTVVQDWETELKRCGCTSWRVCLSNENFNICESLPEAFVVPAVILGKDVNNLAPLCNGRRFPTWSWGTSHGNVLVRMSGVFDIEQESQILETIKKGIPQPSGLQLFSLDDLCPSVREIQYSYIKLQGICKPENAHNYWKQESTYLSSLESIRWFHYLSACLETSLKIAESMACKKDSVIIKEWEGRDLSCVISSLVQILLDPFFRTQYGFECLVQKEWVALGHPFQERLGQLGVEDGCKSPVFLLFLDCLWQILQQFPSSFEFTETYLTNLWDTVHISCFDTFLFNCQRERANAYSKFCELHRLQSAWDWSLQFTKQDMIFFQNPLYILTAKDGISHSRPWSIGCDGPFKSRGQPLTLAKKAEKRECDLLELDPSVMNMQLWRQCYLRWIPLAQVVGGDLPLVYLQNLVIWDEICALQKLLESPQEPINLRHRRVASDVTLYRSEADSSCGVKNNPCIVTSSFPYSPIGPFDWGHFHRVPSSSYLHVDVVGVGEELDE
ncbi:myotubularin-related protein 10-like [Tachypleus tridentatus]|uniref:myotubularin-related protein 10-like n=1 Tax=Tachypleus tridentatus TaxID=6853 RepID=UPI003FD22FA1